MEQQQQSINSNSNSGSGAGVTTTAAPSNNNNVNIDNLTTTTNTSTQQTTTINNTINSNNNNNNSNNSNNSLNSTTSTIGTDNNSITDSNNSNNNNNSTNNNNNNNEMSNTNSIANIGTVKSRGSSNNLLHSSTGVFMQSCLSFLLRTYTVKRWFEKMIGESFTEEFYTSLKDGVFLCRLMLSIKLNSIPKIHTGTTLNFKIRENLLFFIQAMEDIGVSRYYQFAVADIMEKKNHLKVLESLEVLADIASTDILAKDQPEKAIEPLTDEQAAELQFSEKEIADTEQLLKKQHITQVKRQPCKRSLFANEPKQNHHHYGHRSTNSSGFLASSNSFISGSSHTRLSSSGSVSVHSGGGSSHSLQSSSSGGLTSSGTQRPIARASLSPGQIIQKARPHEKKWIRIQSLVRGHLTRIKYHKRVRMAAYRHNIVKEILSTEDIYVKNLENLQNFYFEPLTENASKLNIKAAIDDQLKKIFSNVEVIRNYNRSLLLQLKPVVEEWSSSKKIGPLFIQFIFLLKVYTQYVKEYTVSYEAINNMRKNNSKFDTFISEKEVIDGRSMSDYLILPVQRIPRYTLLLADLVKNTWSDHIDFQDLTESLKRMQEVALSINEKKREAENIQKVTEIQNNFIGKFENLAEPHRRFVHEGALSVINPGGKESQRIFYLFNDVLIGTKPTTSGLLNRKTALKVKESIRMNLVSLRTKDQQQTTSSSTTPLSSSQEKQQPTTLSSSQEKQQQTTTLSSSQEKPPLHPTPSSSKPPQKPPPKIPDSSNSFKTATHSNTTQQQTFLRQSAPPTTNSASKPPVVNDPPTRSRTSTNSPTGIAPLPYKNRTMTSVTPPAPPPQANKPTYLSSQKPPASANKPPMPTSSSSNNNTPPPSSTPQSSTTTTTTPQSTTTNQNNNSTNPPTDNTTTTTNNNSTNDSTKSNLIIELVDSFNTCILKLLCPSIKERNMWISEFKKVQDDLDTRKMVNDEAMKRSQEKAGLAKAALSQQYATLRVRGRHLPLSDMKAEEQEGDQQQPSSPTGTSGSGGGAPGLPIGFANPAAERDFQILRRQTIARRSQNGTVKLDSPDGASSSSAPSTPTTSSPALTSIGSVSPKNSKEDLMSSTKLSDSDSASDDSSNKKSTISRAWFSLRLKKKKPTASSILESAFIDPNAPVTSSTTTTTTESDQ